MPAPTPILDKDKDLAPYFGVACDGDDAELLWMIQRFVESAARKFVRHGITRQSYTEYHRKTNIGPNDSYGTVSGEYELIGDRVYSPSRMNTHGDYLQLDNGFVRSVASVYEDYSAEFGQGSGDFPASTLLTAGTDYAIELDESGLSKSGRLIRINRGWSTNPGTIKVTYTAGFAPSELDGEWSHLKLALLHDIAEAFNEARSQKSGGYGALKKEVIIGDIQREYAVDTKSKTSTVLSFRTMSLLQPLKVMRL